MKKIYVKIEGIHCKHCIEVITNEFKKNKNIDDIKIRNNIAHITYSGKLTKKEIINTLSKIDYLTKEEYITDNINEIDEKIKIKQFLLILLIIFIIWEMINKIFGYNIFNVIPNIDSSVTYAMLFTTGLLTSIHCISMCGAINLVAQINSNSEKKFKIKRG